MTSTINNIEPTTSASDKLRAMLDERGVEWRERKWGGKHSVTTFWRARGVRWHYRENRFGEVRLHADGLAPEQAIAATLGAGTCHPIISDNLAESEGTGDAWADCSECGHLLFVLTDSTSEPPNYCPNCGKRVVGVDE